MRGGVAERKVDFPSAPSREEALPPAVEDDVRLAGFLAPDFHIVPGQMRANASAKSFGNGFLAGESRGDKGARGFVGETVGEFVREENAAHEAIPVFFIRQFNAAHFNQIDAGAENQAFLPPSSVPGSVVIFHGQEHFAHGGGDADNQRAADDAVAYVQFHQMRHLADGANVLVIQAVTGVDLQVQIAGLPGGGDQPLRFPRAFPLAMKILRERPGVQFNELCADAGRGFDLRRVWRDKKADVNARVV